ncbi:MAG TPA: hypothetical protein VEU47_11815 [Candidatus Cybelea sp.]|nr:hypothetical protein [Candidatus Cybelea sp.]
MGNSFWDEFSTCQWLDGEPGKPGWAVRCGAPVAPGSAFCAAHRARCYLPPGTDAWRYRQWQLRIDLMVAGFDDATACELANTEEDTP